MQFIIVVGRSRQGIHFESPDGMNVKLLLLVGIPRENVSHYLKILAQLARLLKRGPLREKLREAQDKASALAFFKQMP
jgi:mannitol/fructose-specific phosphotransferase system IIA component (Ntr-type)